MIEMVSPGFGASLQDLGRHGWRRFGVPGGGAMDDHAAGWANRLLDNPPVVAVLELLLHGAVFTARQDLWIALTGAVDAASHPGWRAMRVQEGETIQFPRPSKGNWSYLAVEGGFDGPHLLGSASVYVRGGLGQAGVRGDLLRRVTTHSFQLPAHVAGRVAPWSEQRNYGAPPKLRVWPGPQWAQCRRATREQFFAQDWKLTSQCDRIGYRLSGEPLAPAPEQIISEPVRVGTIQIPPNGQPIITLRDGPTVGGYAKLGLVHAADLSWLVQCSPGQSIRFQPMDEI